MATRAVTLTTTALQVVAWNPDRTALSFTNNSAIDIFLSQDPTAVTTGGYVVAAGNGLDLIMALGDETATEWFGQVGAATADVRILEANGRIPALFSPSQLKARGE